MQVEEYGPTGPTAVKDMNPAGTGLTDVAAAFIAANASPFTNPRDLPTLAKVPDPRNTQQTKTMFIWGHFDIPAVSVNGSGAQLVCSSPDPLAPIPVVWMGGNAADDTTTRRNPNRWARLYEQAGLQDMIFQQRELGARAKQYRVVGHGLKVWVSRNTTISRGNIEAGQFNFADTRNLTPTNPNTTVDNSTTGFIGYHGTDLWTNAPGTSADHGYHGMALQNADYNKYRSMLATAKEQDLGFLAADEGATVRWTDSSEFQFQQATDRGCIFPTAYMYGTQAYLKYESANLNPDFTNVTEANAIQFWPTVKQLIPTAGFSVYGPVEYADLNQLGSLNYVAGNGHTQAYYTRPTSVSSSGAQEYTTHNFYGKGDREYSTFVYNSTDTHWTEYISSPDKQFNRGLYCDVNGIDLSQVLTVQVCWHIEYVPKGTEPWDAEPSPVDTQFDVISTLLRDRRAFPIVVKGHSFFSSLFNAVKKAGSMLVRGVSKAAPIASSVLSMVPDPRAQGMSVGFGILGTAASALGQINWDKAKADNEEYVAAKKRRRGFTPMVLN